jgi:hypothetical protein
VIQYPPPLAGHLPTSIEVYVSQDNPPKVTPAPTDAGTDADAADADAADADAADADAADADAADADAGTATVQSPHGNFTIASGSLAEIMNATDTQLSVLNATCAPYSMRMVIRAQVTALGAGAADAP